MGVVVQEVGSAVRVLQEEGLVFGDVEELDEGGEIDGGDVGEGWVHDEGVVGGVGWGGDAVGEGGGLGEIIA